MRVCRSQQCCRSHLHLYCDLNWPGPGWILSESTWVRHLYILIVIYDDASHSRCHPCRYSLQWCFSSIWQVFPLRKVLPIENESWQRSQGISSHCNWCVILAPFYLMVLLAIWLPSSKRYPQHLLCGCHKHLSFARIWQCIWSHRSKDSRG